MPEDIPAAGPGTPPTLSLSGRAGSSPAPDSPQRLLRPPKPTPQPLSNTGGHPRAPSSRADTFIRGLYTQTHSRGAQSPARPVTCPRPARRPRPPSSRRPAVTAAAPPAALRPGLARSPPPRGPSGRLSRLRTSPPRREPSSSGSHRSALREEAATRRRAALPAAGRRARGTQRWPATGPDVPQRPPVPPGRRGAAGTHRHPIVLQPEKTPLPSAPLRCPALSSRPAPPARQWSLPALRPAPCGRSHSREAGGAAEAGEAQGRTQVLARGWASQWLAGATTNRTRRPQESQWPRAGGGPTSEEGRA